MNEPEEPKTRERQRVILEVLARRMNVTQAALELGISRKTYYEWQERSLLAMRAALRDRPGGRPSQPVDPEKERLQATVERLEKERLVLEGRLRIQHAIQETVGEVGREKSPPKKKKERCERMIAIVEQVKRELRVPCEAVCRELGVPRSSLMRWKSRQKAGEAVVGRPGPAKIEPLNLDTLHEEILELAHGRRRTRGTGTLYDRHRGHISRRDLQRLVAATRRELRQEEQAMERRIEWLVPGAVWSMDDTQKHWLEDRFGHMHLVMDLGSRYNLRAWGAEAQANGSQVAMNLGNLFRQYGPPLFLKMDGGSNFQHHEVRHTLDEYGVIPLISPPYYPPYNGGIERGHQQMLRHLEARIGSETFSVRELRLECEVAAHEVNHKRRPSLGDRTACFTLESGRHRLDPFGRRKRKEVLEEIKTLAVDIVDKLREHPGAVAETAFRYAAETWMQSNDMIRVTRNGEVLPPFYRFQSH